MIARAIVQWKLVRSCQKLFSPLGLFYADSNLTILSESNSRIKRLQGGSRSDLHALRRRLGVAQGNRSGAVLDCLNLAGFNLSTLHASAGLVQFH